MRVFCHKWFNFYPGCLLHLPLFLKTFKKYNVLSLHGLPNSHTVLPVENSPMGIPTMSSALLNYRDLKQSCSLPFLIASLWGQTDNHCVVPAQAALLPPSRGVKVAWIPACPSKADFWETISFTAPLTVSSLGEMWKGKKSPHKYPGS